MRTSSKTSVPRIGPLSGFATQPLSMSDLVTTALDEM
jgi:hypothetical protein